MKRLFSFARTVSTKNGGFLSGGYVCVHIRVCVFYQEPTIIIHVNRICNEKRNSG